MKIIKLSALLVMSSLGMSGTVVSAQSAEGHDQPQVQKAPASRAHVLTREELDKFLSQPGKVLLIDVRRPDEIASIGGFPVYLSIQLKDLEDSLACIPRNRVLVTVSNYAARAGRAADLLASKGFKVAGVVGAQVYEKQGGTLRRVVVPAPRN